MQVQVQVLSKMTNDLTKAFFDVGDFIAVSRCLDSPVFLEGETLSRHHFFFFLKGDDLQIEDRSSNGTWLNGKPLKKHSCARVRSGDLIEISGYRMEIQLGIPESGDEDQLKGQPAQSPVNSKLLWIRPLATALNFFDKFEMILILLAVSILALSAFYLTR